MASGLKLVLFILLITCTPMSYPTSKRFKFKNDTNRTLSSQSILLRKNKTVLNGSGTCNITINQTVLTVLSRLIQDSDINIVYLRLHVVRNESKFYSKVRWAWVNKIGIRILSILHIVSFLDFDLDLKILRTLTVRRIKLDVQVYENPPRCIPSGSYGRFFVGKTLLQKLSSTSNTEYQLLYWTKRTCKIIYKDRQNECYAHPSYLALTNLIYYYFCVYTIVLAFFFSYFFLNGWFLKFSRERKYYKITDSPMSLSSIIYSVFFEGDGPVKTFVRRITILGLVAWFRFYFFLPKFLDWNLISKKISISNWFLIGFDFFFIFCAIFFPCSHIIKPKKHTMPNHLKWQFSLTEFLKLYAGYDVTDIFLSDYNYQHNINILTLPFNIKRWRSGKLENFFLFTERPASRGLYFYEEIWVILKRCFFYLIGALCCLVYVFVISLVLFFLIIIDLLIVPFNFLSLFSQKNCVSRNLSLERKQSCLSSTVNFFIDHGVILIISGSFVLVFIGCQLSIIILLLFTGLILNAVYFIPYITFISVLTFYSWTFWKSLETKYFTLKMQIYEVCKAKFNPDNDSAADSSDDGDVDYDDFNSVGFSSLELTDDIDDHDDGGGDDDHDDDDNDHAGNNNGNSRDGDGSHIGNGDTVGNDENDELRFMTKWKYNHNNEPMISKLLYDQVRERILPYHLHLFHFFLKVCVVFLFAYFMFAVVDVLKTTNISGTVKVITTMSVSVVPYIFNIVAAKLSEEEQKAQKEVQKIKVEKLVSELTEGTDQVYQIYMEMSDDEI